MGLLGHSFAPLFVTRITAIMFVTCITAGCGSRGSGNWPGRTSYETLTRFQGVPAIVLSRAARPFGTSSAVTRQAIVAEA
jgi:hypothetical protein